MDHQFRSVAFGGFHKQDVLDFLEANSRDHAQQLQELQKRVEEQTKQLESAQAEVENLRARLEQAESSRDQLQGTCQELTERLEQAEGERDELSGQLAESRAKAERLEPDAEAYLALKERTAGVELEAHRRAQEVEDQAAGQAQRVREGAQSWLKALEQEYDRLRTETETTVAHAAAQLDRAGEALDQISRLMDRQAGQLEHLEQICGQQPGTNEMDRE